MKRNLIKTLAFASVALVFASCLKDKRVERQDYGMINYSGANRIVELPAPTPGGFMNINLNFATTDTTFTLVTVNLAAEQVAQEDVSVTLVMNPTLVANYNAANGTNYTSMPASQYTLDPLTVVIPKGSRFGLLKVKMKPSDAAQGEYAFGFSIASVSNPAYIISGNFRNVVMAVGVKNSYDGLYQLNGFFTHPTPAFVGGFVRTDIELRTFNANAVVMWWRAAGTYAHPFTNNGSFTYFGSQSPIFTINPTTFAVSSVVNYYPAGPAYALNPSYNNRYVPATRTIFAEYGYPTARQYTDTLRYLGPR